MTGICIYKKKLKDTSVGTGEATLVLLEREHLSFLLCKPCFSSLGGAGKRNIPSLERVGICALASSTTVSENVRKKIIVTALIFLPG